MKSAVGSRVVWWSGGLVVQFPYDYIVKWWSGGLVVWWSGGLVVWTAGRAKRAPPSAAAKRRVAERLCISKTQYHTNF